MLLFEQMAKGYYGLWQILLLIHFPLKNQLKNNSGANGKLQ
jgi:hypothetical protein